MSKFFYVKEKASFGLNYLSSYFIGSNSAIEISKDDIGVGAVKFGEMVSTSISDIPKNKNMLYLREKK